MTAAERPSHVRIRPSALAVMLDAYRSAHGCEPCGLLLGRVDGATHRVEEAASLSNVHRTPDRAFRIDPDAHLAALRSARAKNLTVLGFWHGHRAGPASPGRADTEGLRRAEADARAFRVLIILGHGSGRAPVARAYVCGAGAEDDLREIPLGS